MKQCPICNVEKERFGKHFAMSQDSAHSNYVQSQKERVYRLFLNECCVYTLLKDDDFYFSEDWIRETCYTYFGRELTFKQNCEVKRKQCSISTKKRYDIEHYNCRRSFVKKCEQNSQEVQRILDEWRSGFALSKITHKVFSQNEICQILREYDVYDVKETRRRGMLKALDIYSLMSNKVHERWVENIQRKIRENTGIVEEIVNEWNKETPLYKIRNDLFNKEEIIWILDQQNVYDKEESLRRGQKGLIVGRANVQQQHQVIALFEEILQTKFESEKTWKWFKREKSRGHFSVDGYSEDLKLVVEFDGYQHYTFPNVYHRTREEFEYQQETDQLKTQLLAEHNIKLLRIREDEPRTKEYLIQRLIMLNVEIPQQKLVA